MKRFYLAQLSSLALAALLAGPPTVLAQQQSPSTNSQVQSQPEQTQQGTEAFSRIRAVAGSDLIGKPVHDKDGMLVGEVEYLLVNPANARVADVVVGPGTTLAEQYRMKGLRAIPWDHMSRDFSNNGEIRTLALQISRDELARAPMVDANDIQGLTSPQYQARVINYYVPTAPQPSNQTSQNQNNAGQGAPTGSASQTQPSVGQYLKSNKPTSNMAALGKQGKRDTQSGPSPDQQTTNQKSAQLQGLKQSGKPGTEAGPVPAETTGSTGKAETQSRSSSPPNGYVLVGRAVITALMPPDFQLASQLRGANVVSADGQDLGDIDRLVIDADRGYVAYVLVSQGGYLGSGEETHAVPLQALAWHGGETFVLNMNAQDYFDLPPVMGDQIPKLVRRGDVEQLYQAFGLQPYWQAV